MGKTRDTQGFTLLELLVVMAILIALMALIVPAMMSRQEKSRINQANIKVKQFENELELYSTENRGYPTTEQGLMALLYIPDNAGLARSTLMSQQGVQPGMTGMEGGAFGMGEAGMVGDNAMAPVPGIDGGMVGTPPGTMTGTNMTGGANPMVPTGPPGFDGAGATGGMDMGGGVPGMMDPMNPGSMTGSTMSGWTQPEYNPAIYTQLRKRPQPYIEKEQDLTDPWGTPYRYENNLAFNGLNRTGTAKPAIWSAGPDRTDFTDDDIPNWDPVDAQQAIAARQQQLQMGGGQMGGPMDPMNPMDPSGMDPMNPMQPNPLDGGMQPMTPTPMTPTPMTPTPMTPTPMTPTPMTPTAPPGM